MNVRKVFGKNSREALREVKRLLGPDAAVLSTRVVEGGVEIAAMSADDIPPAVPQAAPPGVPTGASAAMPPGIPHEFRPRSVAASAPRQAAAPAVPASDTMVQTIVSEIASMRSTIEQQLDGLMWGDMQRRNPGRMALLRTLLQAGFSPALSRKITDHLPPGSDTPAANQWVQAAMARNLPIAQADAMVAAGGVYALMGPTGVGKTTTTAKLAARCVVRHGASSLALLTTDSYRIGGQEQLRIYGRILGVPVHAVHDGADLMRTLADLQNKHMVLIDTVGVSQRDQMVAEQVAMLCGGNAKRLLLLNATCSGQTLDDVIQAYQGNGLYGCIITKLDEAVGIGATLDSIVRHRLPLHYIANGQRVPEDLHTANADYLVHRALKMGAGSAAHEIAEDELPLLMGRQSGDRALGGLHLA